MQITSAEPLYGKIISAPSLGNTAGEPFTKNSVDTIDLEKHRSSVQISGQSLMMRRVFFSEKPDYKPPFVTEFSENTYMMPCSNFLNQDDRQLIVDMYEYAQEEGADLRYVDGLALNLAWYRYDQDGKYVTPQSAAGHCDRQGHKVIYGFTDRNAATAKRILSSESLSSTRLDQKYIRHKLDADYGVLNHPDLDFMELMINKFSAKGNDSPPLGGLFSQLVERNDVVKHVSNEIFYQLGGRTGDAIESESSDTKTQNNKGQQAPVETLKDILRRIIFSAMSSNSRNSLHRLVDFIMKSRR